MDNLKKPNRRLFRDPVATIVRAVLFTALILAGCNDGSVAAQVPVEAPPTVPLPELGADFYQWEIGGLYADGSNDMPNLMRRRYERRMRRIAPLNTLGEVDSTDGVILVISASMSNGSQFWCSHHGGQECREDSFTDQATREDLNPYLRIVNCSELGQSVNKWIRAFPAHPSNYDRCAEVLAGFGYTPAQVQIVWTITAQNGEAEHPLMPHPDSDMLETAVVLREMVATMRRMWPSATALYLQSRTLAFSELGDPAGQQSPHPWEYETAFASKRVIVAREGRGRLGVFWGPYFYSNGWPRAYVRSDGVHPSYPSGVRAGAALMIDFFRGECWFLASSTC